MYRFPVTGAVLLLLTLTCLGRAVAGETLYNGIVLPDTWPPRPAAFPREEPTPPPYLAKPPEVIPIDVGRQLFVDDFLVENTTLQRTYHQPAWHPSTPVLKSEQPWEVRNSTPFAAPFSDGVWFDPKDNTFKMWYMGGNSAFFCYATSTDGIRWQRPKLDVFGAGGNVLKIEPVSRDSSTVWLDHEEKDPERRFKLVYYRAGLQTRFSPDGIHWSKVVVENRSVGDRTTVFYNPFRKVWVFSVRSSASGVGRCRYYAEQQDLAKQPWKSTDEMSRWTCADQLDRVRKDDFVKNLPDLYNLDATPYESLMLGLFTIHSKVADGPRPKINHVTLGYSRDGFHWHRPDRRAFLNVAEDNKAWNYGNVQSAGGGCLVVGDKLYFYCSGRNSGKVNDDGTGGATGLAILRRDGFASMKAGEDTGTLTTRPVRFSGTHLFVNAACPRGELRVEVLGRDGKVVAPFSLDNCVPVQTDRTIQAVSWKGAKDLTALANKPVRFRFHLRQGELYSFWVSPDGGGASQGYVAAGGPGFTGSRDTAGSAAYKASDNLKSDK